MNQMEDSDSFMFKLIATNYFIQKLRMKDILFCKDLCDPNERQEAKLTDKTDKE